MKRLAIVLFALLVPLPGAPKKRDYHWKTGTLSFLSVETEQPTTPPSPDLTLVTGTQNVQTWTYQVDGTEGIYVVKISPEPLSTPAGAIVQYDVDGKVMHIDATEKGRKTKIVDLKILRFTRR
jgi:hypothetical protein